MTFQPAAATLDPQTLAEMARAEFGQGQAVPSEIEQELAAARKAQRWLRHVAIAQTALVIGTFALAHPVNGEYLTATKIRAGTAIFNSALFGFLTVWAYRAPLAASLSGVSVFLTTWWATVSYNYALLERQFGIPAAADGALAPDFSTLIKFAILFGLLRAVRAGARYQRLLRRGSADEGRTRIAGVWTSLGLFVSLVYLSINMIANWGDGVLTPLLFKKLVGVTCIVIFTWSVASWRDVYRPLIKPVNPIYYLVAIGAALVTFTISHGWVQLVQSAIELPQPTVVNPDWQNVWWMELLLICVQPAIFEELAFRGIIFAGLARSMRAHEAVIVSALMFMVLHMNPPMFPHLLILGLALGYLRYRSGSWLPGMFLHFTHNFLATVAGAHH